MYYAFILPLVVALIQGNQSAPSFQEQVIDPNISIGYGLAIGNVDNDGKPDIILADKKQFVWYRNGDWKRFVLADDLTESDNVCIAARDIDGDGKVEIAVGAQWNPGETSDTTKSGSVHYLIRPGDPTKPWKAVKLHHEPTIHRMKWVRVGNGKYQLVVLPLHGRSNNDGVGRGVKVFAYERPSKPEGKWKMRLVDSTMHMTHNFELVEQGDRETLFIGGKEGVKMISYSDGKWSAPRRKEWYVPNTPMGELRWSKTRDTELLAGIQPMHGNTLAVYKGAQKILLSLDLNQGHALGLADIMGDGSRVVIAGWREANKEGKVGIKLYRPDEQFTGWKEYWLDNNGMACEDLQVADLNNDGKPDIVAAGRSTHNVKIYWNRN